VDISGSFPTAQYVDQIVDAKGLKVRAYIRGPDLKPVRELLAVAIDLRDFSFT
jgi:hypothetical protein